jgi:hypothetical protein
VPADRAAFLAMEGYGALYVLCVRSARRGRMLGSIGRGADVPVPPPVSVEDDETATDAIGEAWALLAKGAEHPAPVLLARSIAKRLGQRRAQHRIRLRTGLTDAPTDRTMPADDAKRTVAELLAVASPARRAALGRALAQRQEGKRGRKATGAVPMTGAERVAKHRKAKRESNANTSARV